MGIFQEAAISMGDLVTQPIRKFIAEKATGMKFKINRQVIRDSHIHETQARIVYEYKVKWDLVAINSRKKKQPFF